MTDNKRFTYWEEDIGEMLIPQCRDNNKIVARSVYECVKLLNELNDECEFLEIDNKSLEHGATKYAELYHKSLKENEQLKQELKTTCIVNKQYEENQQLIKMLDNVANYMQKQHKDMPIDDFVEWWNNIATEGL